MRDRGPTDCRNIDSGHNWRSLAGAKSIHIELPVIQHIAPVPGYWATLALQMLLDKLLPERATRGFDCPEQVVLLVDSACLLPTSTVDARNGRRRKRSYRCERRN